MRVLILTNNDVGLYNFRKELLEKLIELDFEVYVSLPVGNRINDIESIGCKYIKSEFDRHGKNILNEFRLVFFYNRVLKKYRPDIILTYTIKPNLYGSLVASINKIPYIVNITGLGTVFEKEGLLSKVIIKIYRIVFKNANCIFFQNSSIMEFFDKNKIYSKRAILLPGSGINLDEFCLCDYPDDNKISFAFISRIMKDKGIDEYLYCAEKIKQQYPNVDFHICGSCEDEYASKIDNLANNGNVIYHGNIDNTRDFLSGIHCIIHPSYHEGMSNVLLEAAATGRPGICSDIPGCREIVEDGKTGYLFTVKDREGLVREVEKFLKMSYEQKRQMGINARKKVEKEFNRNIVINEYINEINRILGDTQ